MGDPHPDNFDELWAQVEKHKAGIRDFAARSANAGKAEMEKVEEGETYDIKTHEELVAVLEKGGIDLSVWGQGKAKSTKRLFEEIEAGESVLTKTTSNPVVRTLNVCSLNVARKGRVLVETHQSLPDTKVWRHRFQIPGEKMKSTENGHDACIRGCMEEFDCIKDEVTVKEVKDVRLENVYSGSFPGLLTSYKLHDVHCDVANPNIKDDVDYFLTVESKGDDKTQEHLWVWYPLDLWEQCIKFREAEGLGADTAFLKEKK